MNEKKTTGERFWKITVLVMMMMLGTQSFLMYTMMNDKKGESSTTLNESSDALTTLTPRKTNPLPTCQLNQTFKSAPPAISNNGQSNISLPPLPQVNINMNGQNGRPILNQPPQCSMQQTSPNYIRHGTNINSIRNHMRMNMIDEIAQMKRLMNSVFNMQTFSGFMGGPSGFVNQSNISIGSSAISQKGDEYVFKIEIPGMDKSGIKANINGNTLTIFGTKRSETSDQGQMINSYSSSYSSFQNSFSLPGPVQADKMKMEYDNDILTIRIPKA